MVILNYKTYDMKKFLKSSLVACCAFLVCCLGITQLAAPAAYAGDEDTQSGAGSTSNTECGEPILGFYPWCYNVKDFKQIGSTSDLSGVIWTIVGNVATDLTVAASYLVLGYVIYGGYLYIFAAGDPNKVAAGKKTLSQAFIGLAIVMSASIILNTIRITLSFNGANLSFQECLTENLSSNCVKDASDANAMVTHTIQWTIGIAGAVALIFVVYGAISYITSAGDAGKTQKAKNVILYSLIGLVIVALAEIITSFVSARIRESTQTSLSYPNSSIALTLNEKEFHEIKPLY